MRYCSILLLQFLFFKCIIITKHLWPNLTLPLIPKISRLYLSNLHHEEEKIKPNVNLYHFKWLTPVRIGLTYGADLFNLKCRHKYIKKINIILEICFNLYVFLVKVWNTSIYELFFIVWTHFFPAVRLLANLVFMWFLRPGLNIKTVTYKNVQLQ